jgi:hypothetical protein
MIMRWSPTAHGTIGIRAGSTACTLARKQNLAALIHLCGAGAADEYARRGFKLAEGQRCGDHQARAYIQRVEAMQSVFDRLEAAHECDRERRR